MAFSSPLCTFLFIMKLIALEVKIGFNKSYDDSVKLKRTEMDPFRLG